MTNTTTGLEICVDGGKCLAYGNCVSIAPDFLDLPAKAKTVIVLKREVGEDEIEELEEAVRSCPVRALSIIPTRAVE